jgi:acetyl-CoA C-acetyltransferase
VVTARPDLAGSIAQDLALRHALDAAGLTMADIAHLDLYSCFPIAVTSAAAALGLDPRGERALTLTGGLPFFGGPGNNYSMHAICEAIARVRAAPDTRAMVVANGGYLSKHSVGIYGAARPGPWAAVAGEALQRAFDAAPRVALAPESTAEAVVESWVMTLRKGTPEVAYVAARAGDARLLARPGEGDVETLAAMAAGESIGRRIALRHDGQVHRFRFAD